VIIKRIQNQATNLLCHSHPPSVVSSTPLKKKLWYSIFELRILLIILKQLIFEYGGSPYNVAIFLVFFPKYKYCEEKFNVRCSECRKWHSRASNFKHFLGENAPDHRSNASSEKPPLLLTNQTRSDPDINI
jgi:hypothetical protein